MKELVLGCCVPVLQQALVFDSLESQRKVGGREGEEEDKGGRRKEKIRYSM